jgi:hypothetical protein
MVANRINDTVVITRINEKKEKDTVYNVNHVLQMYTREKSTFYFQIAEPLLILNGTKQSSLDIKPKDLVQLQNSSAACFLGDEMYVLQSDSTNTSHKYEFTNGGTMVYNVNLVTGQAKQLFKSADEGDVGILVGAMAVDDDYLYYTLGPYGSYAIVSQNRKTGEIATIQVIRDQKSGNALIPIRLFVYNDDLWASLTDDNESADFTILARVDPHSGEYREEVNFKQYLGDGRIMQRMSSVFDNYLLAWFANSEGSTSSLIAIDLETSQIDTIVDYHSQRGNWRALSGIC